MRRSVRPFLCFLATKIPDEEPLRYSGDENDEKPRDEENGKYLHWLLVSYAPIQPSSAHAWGARRRLA
jgi:hypothetical protein